MKKIVCVAVSLTFSLFIMGCSGSDSSTKKSKFEVMADVLTAISNAGMDESGYGDRSLTRSVEEEELAETFGPETYEIAPGFSITISGEILFEEFKCTIEFIAESELTNYTNDGFILNGNLTESVKAIITMNEEEFTGMTEDFTINGTIEFSGRESGSFSFNNLEIHFVLDPQTGAIVSSTVTGTVTFNGQDVTTELVGAMHSL
ncbi:MAG: hypothetical protein N3F66_11885 [Spirochaetes bacterium]|nr:hypothetical protein [Spirochaetota bacterium]